MMKTKIRSLPEIYLRLTSTNLGEFHCMIVFWNKNTQTFCFTDSLLAEFLDHLNVKKIFRYCKALNATTKPSKSALRGRGCECQQVIS